MKSLNEILRRNAYVGAGLIGVLLLEQKYPFVLLIIIGVFTILYVVFWILSLLIRGPYSKTVDDWAGFIKVLCEVPLGFGSVLGFKLLDRHYKLKYIFVFSYYVNIAVLGNIAMMALTPTGKTRRGILGRIVCILLTIWLAMECHRVNWLTVKSESDAFVFIASPMPWVISHAVYRLGLLTLPVFGSLKYLTLEPFSLSFMYLLWRMYDGELEYEPVSYYFGYADTIVAASMSLFSVLQDDKYNHEWKYDERLQRYLDNFFVPLHVMNIIYILSQILSI